MEKILTVYGDGSTGKTTVINEIYDELLKKGATVVVARKKQGANPNDFTGVLEYNHKTIAFLSMGDYRNIVDDYVLKFRKYDVFITALNRRFSCISTSWLKNSSVIYKFDKISPDNVDNVNVKKSVISKI